MMALFGTKKYKIVYGNYGARMILKSPWVKEMAKKTKKVKELELNHVNGWKGDNLSFLQQIPQLVVFEIIDFRIRDVSGIHYLNKLKVLDVNTYCNTEIDFSHFPRLEDVSLEWRKVRGFFECKNLKRIFVNHYSGDNLEEYSNFSRLEHLSLKSPRIESIGKINALENLTQLLLGNATKLTSLEGIEKLENLKTLEIMTCKKIFGIEPVQKLKNLEKLFICNCGDIKSLKPLVGLDNLREVHFYESTKILDGDLTPLKQLPKLKKTSFQERRYYNLGWSDFGMNYPKNIRELLKQECVYK